LGVDVEILKHKAAIGGKRNIMNLLLEKLLEYFKHQDPSAETVVGDIAT
jgi:hypothetical protein